MRLSISRTFSIPLSFAYVHNSRSFSNPIVCLALFRSTLISANSILRRRAERHCCFPLDLRQEHVGEQKTHRFLLSDLVVFVGGQCAEQQPV